MSTVKWEDLIFEFDRPETMVSEIKERALELEHEERAILDISTYPDLSRTRQSMLGSHPTYYVPDTIAKLFFKAKEDRRYYYYMTRLFMRSTRRYIDLDMLDGMFSRKEHFEARVELITEEMVDKRVYSFCYENFVSKDLILELSPRFNLVGDIIGKILGVCQKSRAPILMTTGRLVSDVRRLIPIFETANAFIDTKRTFFHRFIPGIEETRGVRWIIGITIGIAYPQVGIALAIIDP